MAKRFIYVCVVCVCNVALELATGNCVCVQKTGK